MMLTRSFLIFLCMTAAAAGYSRSPDSTAALHVPETFLFEQAARTSKKAVEKQIGRDIRKLWKLNDKHAAANKRLRKQLSRLDIHADTLKKFSPVQTKELEKLKKYDAILNKELKTDKYNQALADLRKQVTDNQKQSRYIQQGLNQLQLDAGKYDTRILKKIKIAMDMKRNWQAYYDDQDKMETALLYFVEKYNKTNPVKSPYQQGSTNESLTREGYQTTQGVKQRIQDKFGMDDEQYNKLLTEKQEAAQRAHLDKLQELKTQAQQARGKVQELQNTYQGIRYNKVRATPFRLRFKPVYNFNIQPKNIVTNNNSLFISIGLEQKLSEDLRQGIGFNSNIGFNIRKPYYLKYDHCFLFYYIKYHLVWGISLQGGYELNVYNRYSNSSTPDEQGDNPFREYLTRNHNNIAYLGLSKSYRINNSWHGTLLVGYDFLWDKVSTSQSTPWIIRLGIRKN